MKPTKRVIIGVCGRKGGSGKTTTAVHLASELASRGVAVVLVDCDPQKSAAHWNRDGQLPMPVYELPIESQEDAGKLNALVQRVDFADKDFLVLDSPPHLNAALGAVIGMSDVIVIPCGPSGVDFIATAETVGLAKDLKATSAHITLVPNRVDLRTSAGRQLEAELSSLGEDVSPAVHSRTALADSFNLGAWVGAYAPGSAAHLEVQALTTHVLSLIGQKPGKKRL